MKKILCIFLTCIILFSLSGCSGDKKSEEQLKAEIKAELQAEMAKEQAQNNSQAASGTSKVDMKDLDALYEFVKKEIVDIPRESFNTWEVSYFDITGDGTDEAVLVSRYGADWYKKMEIISGDGGQFKRIPSDISLAKNGDVPAFEDDFLAVLSGTSGSGMQETYMHLYVYDGSKMVKVLDVLTTEYRVAAPNTQYEEIAEIEGSMKDFTYTLTKHDNITGKKTIEVKEQYTYNPGTMSFDVKQLDKGSQGSTGQAAASSGGTYKLSELKNGDNVAGLTITDIYFEKDEKARFNLKGETVLVGELSLDNTWDVDELILQVTEGPFTSTILELEYSGGVAKFELNRIGFTNQDALLKTLSSSDLNALKKGATMVVKLSVRNLSFDWFAYAGGAILGEFIRIIDKDAPTLTLPGKLSGFTNENIRGEQVNYSDYTAVIVPLYPANGANINALSQIPFGNPGPEVLNFAIFGKVEELTMTEVDTTNPFNETTFSFGPDESENSYFRIQYNLPNDMSHFRVEGKVRQSNGSYTDISFTLDDMRDPSDYQIIFVK